MSTTRKNTVMGKLEEAVCKLLDWETLDERGRSGLDFHEVGVGTMRDVLKMAFDYGVRHAKKKTVAKPIAGTSIESDDLAVRICWRTYGTTIAEIGMYSETDRTYVHVGEVRRSGGIAIRTDIGSCGHMKPAHLAWIAEQVEAAMD